MICGQLIVEITGKIIEFDKSLSKTIERVLLTYTHHDYIYDLNKIYDSYPKVEVYKNVFGLKMLKGGKLNLSRYPFQNKGSDIQITHNDNTIGAILVPYHGLSCICYHIKQ